jgi:hypothetical protein
VLTVVGTHWPFGPPRQQPVGQEEALQLQVPPAPQDWPAVHLGFVPHWHSPLGPHAFA